MTLDEMGEFLEKDSNYDKLVAFSMRILRRDQAEDAVQNSLIKAIKNLDKFDSSKASFKTWLCQIVYNSSIDIYRNSNSRSRFESYSLEDAGSEVYEQISSEEDALDSLLKGERLEKVRDLMDDLTPLRRKALEDYYFNGAKLGSAVGSELNGEPVKAVRCRIFAARKALKEMLMEDGVNGWNDYQEA